MRPSTTTEYQRAGSTWQRLIGWFAVHARKGRRFKRSVLISHIARGRDSIHQP